MERMDGLWGSIDQRVEVGLKKGDGLSWLECVSVRRAFVWRPTWPPARRLPGAVSPEVPTRWFHRRTVPSPGRRCRVSDASLGRVTLPINTRFRYRELEKVQL